MARTKRKNPKALGQRTTPDSKVNVPDRDGWTPLMKACAWEALENVKKLIAAGADINKPDDDGFGPMMCACVEGRSDIVQFLLAHGAEVDRADELGRTPLSWMVTKGDFVEAAEVLISAGADVNRADTGGFTPLMRAALLNHVRCFELLLRNGADTAPVNACWKKTALEMAIERGSEQLRRIAESIRSGQHRRT